MPDGDASVFVDQIFRIFDKDENGSIDFNVSFLNLIFNWFSAILEENMVATNMTSSGSIEEKLRWAFKMYDKDESG